ncbi:MAG: hypothetical protein FWE21_09235, partial [Defluviitaleaceae bacterium]|nr:hypothetical protein [Defluviitaleaceae bacterium]
PIQNGLPCTFALRKRPLAGLLEANCWAVLDSPPSITLFRCVLYVMVNEGVHFISDFVYEKRQTLRHMRQK